MEAILVLLKVGIAIGGWLVVFLMTFLGYLTLPVIVLFVFLAGYSLIDLLGRKIRKLGQRK
ncbi:MAG: hypothetical protein ACYDAG_18220 [Chloroflexota bacterium]